MKKRILLVSLFGDINTDHNYRVDNIYKAFHNFDMFIVTADFNHATKQYKPENKTDFVHFVHVPAYQNNLSIRRIYSHIVFAIKLYKYLCGLDLLPQLIYCAMPASLTAFYCGRYCKRRKIKFVVDVIDLWPDSLFPISQKYKLIKPLIFPWTYITNKAYSMADYISAESKKYAEVALRKSKTTKWSYTYLGVDIDEMNKLVLSSKVPDRIDDDEIWICYGGSLGNSYDFDSILEAIKFIHSEGIKYRFFFVAEGECRNQISKYIQENKLNAEITGRIPYNDYLKYLSRCDIAINSFKPTTKVVYSYKFNDYVGLKLFVLNNLQGETADMIDDYSIGRNFNGNNLSQILLEVSNNWDSYKTWKENSTKLINEKLNSDMIYKKLADNIILELKV
ncbi:MAG: hypothetical protein WCG08_00630 [Paludibacter sp.]